MEAERLARTPPFDSLPDDVRRKFTVWVGELKVDGVVKTTEELHEENVARQREVEHALERGGLDR